MNGAHFCHTSSNKLARIGFEIVLEENYGLTLEFTLADYQCEGCAIRSASRARSFPAGLRADPAIAARR